MSLEDRVREYYAIFSEGKLKELQALFTDDCLIIDFRGVEHHSTGGVRMFELYPSGANFEVLSLTADGQSVRASFRVTGGPPGHAPEGEDLFVFYGDKIRVLQTRLPES